jgi:hypothetical protein
MNDNTFFASLAPISEGTELWGWKDSVTVVFPEDSKLKHWNPKIYEILFS